MTAAASLQEPTSDAERDIVPARALLSVSDKSGLADFARELQSSGIELFSTGGTGRAIGDAGCAVKDVADYTGFPEMMDGRVKTLHPKIFGGILARRHRDDDMGQLNEHGILPFDLIVVNLYPFEQTIAKTDVSEPEAIEQIDIGGPSLVRAAAKNFQDVAILTCPSQYQSVLDELRSGKGLSLQLRRQLAAAAFARTAEYDRAIADYFSRSDKFPESIGRSWRRVESLRYGENPHQQAAIYSDGDPGRHSLVRAEQLNGKELSYNNYLDLDAAWRIVRDESQPTVSVIKHNNPCGVSTNETLSAAMQRALDCDPTSAFGSVIGLNRHLDKATAEVLATPGLFVEAIVAPSFDAEALEILTTVPKWKANVRLLAYGAIPSQSRVPEVRLIDGGALLQEPDEGTHSEDDWDVVTERQPSPMQMIDLRFAWSMVRHVRSNAIVVAKDQTAWGVGAGQMSRVDAVEIAIRKAADRATGGSLASDAFFPFPDSIERAAEAGISTIIQPGGSKKDPEVIAAANERGMAMVFTKRRHFKH